MSDESIIRTLRERVDELEEENRQLRATLKETPLPVPRCFALTRGEAQLLGILLGSSQPMPVAQIHDRIYGPGHDRCRQVASVHAHRIRGKIKSYGLTIAYVRGHGLWLSPEAKGVIKHLLALEDEQDRLH